MPRISRSDFNLRSGPSSAEQSIPDGIHPRNGNPDVLVTQGSPCKFIIVTDTYGLKTTRVTNYTNASKLLESSDNISHRLKTAPIADCTSVPDLLESSGDVSLDTIIQGLKASPVVDHGSAPKLTESSSESGPCMAIVRWENFNNGRVNLYTRQAEDSDIIHVSQSDVIFYPAPTGQFNSLSLPIAMYLNNSVGFLNAYEVEISDILMHVGYDNPLVILHSQPTMANFTTDTGNALELRREPVSEELFSSNKFFSKQQVFTCSDGIVVHFCKVLPLSIHCLISLKNTEWIFLNLLGG